MSKPILIDGYCGAGGATKGYQRAGFTVIGVDNRPQRNYCGDHFVLSDMLEFLAILAEHGYVDFDDGGGVKLSDIAAFHFSPPCQRHSRMSHCRPGLAESYVDLIAETRDFAEWFGLPYVIENVVDAPMRADIMLCGTMFGRDLYRHRLFEANFPLTQPEHPPHLIPASRAGHWEPGTIMSVSGHIAPVAHAREIMGIDWTNREELAEAIPPYYAEHVAIDLLAYLASERAA
jgi:DNA (cytosine-5)-methyltransferase 1